MAPKRKATWYGKRTKISRELQIVIIVGLTLKSLETFLLTVKGKKTEHIIGVVKDDNSHHFKIFMNLLFWGEGMQQISVWWDERFTRKTELFPDKISNLRGSILKACMFDVKPLIYTVKDTNGTILERHGRDIDVAQALSEIFNFTLVYVDIADEWGNLLPNGTFTGLVGFLGRDEGQMGLAYLYSTGLDDRHKHHEYSRPIDDDKTCFLARIQPPLPAWQNPSLPFQADTWIAFMIGLLLSGPIFYALVMASSAVGKEDSHYGSILSSSLCTIGIHFSHPMAVMPKRPSSQIFIAFLLIYSLILSIGYRSNLTSFLTIARTPKKIETFKDLYDSGFSIKGFQWFYNAFNHSGNFYLRKLLERYEIRDTFEEIVQDIMSGRSTTINSKALLEMTSTLMRTKKGKPLVRFLKECLSTYTVGIGFQLHSPLKPKFDRAIAMLVESGIVRKWSLQASEIYRELVEKEGGVTYYKDDWYASTDGVIPLGLSHMQGIFAVFSLGYILSTIAFAVEVLSC
ncbi:probable glutamate receptor [Palaemon carinicauda]|uniref:probable glutamate receptor n=1 Tax=Palaemon carinicauda TaxID=392227 RepID=UPI0035B6626A